MRSVSFTCCPISSALEDRGTCQGSMFLGCGYNVIFKGEFKVCVCMLFLYPVSKTAIIFFLYVILSNVLFNIWRRENVKS